MLLLHKKKFILTVCIVTAAGHHDAVTAMSLKASSRLSGLTAPRIGLAAPFRAHTQGTPRQFSSEKSEDDFYFSATSARYVAFVKARNQFEDEKIVWTPYPGLHFAQGSSEQFELQPFATDPTHPYETPRFTKIVGEESE